MRQFKLMLLISLVFMILQCFGLKIQAFAWTTETIDTINGYYMIGNTSIAVDSSNHIHITYYDYFTSKLKYTTNASGHWETENIVNEQATHHSMAIDSSGNVHISYSSGSGQLKYATNISGQWTNEIVDGVVSLTCTQWVGDYNSIAVDLSGYVHISYFDETNGDLKYATNSWVSGIWSKKVVESAGTSGLYTSIAVDSNYKVHICYYNTWGYLCYATGTYKSFSKTKEAIASGVVVLSTSIAVDSSGYIHIRKPLRNFLAHFKI